MDLASTLRVKRPTGSCTAGEDGRLATKLTDLTREISLAHGRLRNSGREKLARLWRGALWILGSPWRLLRAFCEGVGFLVVGATSGLAVAAYSFFQTIPDVSKVSFEDVRAAVEAQVKDRLESKAALHPWVDLSDVSRDYLYAIVLSEDAEFFEHGGISLEMQLKAAAENLKKKEWAYGASTITQQVVKNVFLDSEKSLTRKVKELLITRDFERAFSKNQILELYFNLAELGPDIFGVGAAARHYFGKRPSEINAAEGAFIAQMLPSPKRNHYSMFVNRNLSLDKRKRIRRVLRDMLYHEFIGDQQFASYVRYDYFSPAPKVPETRSPAARPARRARKR